VVVNEKEKTVFMTNFGIENGRDTGVDTVSFNCNGCGKCCNSAPLMSIPELFYHENLFVGCLAIRRVNRYQTGDTLINASARYDISTDDVRQLEELAESQLFNPGVKNRGHYDFSIMTQAVDYESLNKCPALGEDRHCTIHHDRKPTVCSMVPFDSLYPDSLQNIVLMSRQFGEDCIAAGERDGYDIVINNRQVVNTRYRNILKQRRDDLYLEKQWWGNAVFAMLQNEVFCNPAEIAKIPVDHGLLSLSIIPVLMTLAGASEQCRDRCLRYVDSQVNLIDIKVNQAIARKSASDKQTTSVLRSFKNHYLKFRPQLAATQPNEQLFTESERDNWITGLENYLEVSLQN
jgi:Fe-S-cluster containining protein